MLKKFLPLAFVAGVVLGAPALAAAQTIGHGDANPVIDVMGRASVTKTAEWASITATIRAQAKDQQTALQLMSAKQDVITAGLKRLVGTRGVKIDTGDIHFISVLPEGCRARDGAEDASPDAPVVQSDSKCAPIGAQASVMITATVWPADQLGPLASLAIQLGAEQAQLGEYGVDDGAALEAEAVRAAYDQALGQAKLLAAAANGRIGRLIRLNRGAADEKDIHGGIVPAASMVVQPRETPPPTIVPAVNLKLTPPKVTESSWVIVEFELLK